MPQYKRFRWLNAADFAIQARNKKRKQVDLVARLKRAEEALSKAGLRVDYDDESSNAAEGRYFKSDHAPKHSPQAKTGGVDVDIVSTVVSDGKLIVERGGSRYIEP